MSPSISAAPAGYISTKLDTGDFYENLEKFQIWLKSGKMLALYVKI
jgi:hypothetical protein